MIKNIEKNSNTLQEEILNKNDTNISNSKEDIYQDYIDEEGLGHEEDPFSIQKIYTNFDPDMLTPRLKLIADQIEKGEKIIDIGTDHGYLPLYLYLSGKCPKVIFSDISNGSLKKAKGNAKLIAPNEKFDFRQGNGLKVIKKEEVDTIVIAGMGGSLMTDILGKDMGKCKNAKKLILQPRSSQGKLRHWLIRKDFNIYKELLVREGRFICEIICASYGQVDDDKKISAGPESLRWELPQWLIDEGGELVIEMLEYKLAREKRILKSMENGKSVSQEEIDAIKDNISYLENQSWNR